MFMSNRHMIFMFPGSSVVEQAAVNRLVAGSSPARGAIPKIFHHLLPYPRSTRGVMSTEALTHSISCIVVDLCA